MIPQATHGDGGRTAGYQPEGSRAPVVLGVAAAVLVIIGVMFVILWVLIHLWADGVQPTFSTGVRWPELPMRSPPAEPRLQSAPPADLAHILSAQRELLETHGHAPDGGTRIPIEQAMKAVARPSEGGAGKEAP